MDCIEGIIQSAIAQRQTHDRVIIAVSGPQGSGKTTCAKSASDKLNKDHNTPSFALSIDDFYLPHSELLKLAETGNPLLKSRGLPGTHDTSLMKQFFTDFVNKTPNLKAPQFDKSLFNGEGDRSGFVDVPPQTQVIVFEGWMLGFNPQPHTLITELMPKFSETCLHPSKEDIFQVNSNLELYEPVWSFINAMIKIEPEKLDYIYKWRLQQEHDLIKAKGTGLSDEQVKRFIDQYYPCYHLYNNSFATRNYPVIVFRIDINHKAI